MGKGAEGARRRDATEVLIEGQLYDVSGFKHPGGSIVKFLTGNGDATDAFREFHGRSRKAKAVLKSLPKRSDSVAVEPRAFNGREALSKDFDAFRAELESEGFFKPVVSEIAYRIAEVVVMHAVGLYLLLATAHTYGALVLLGIASGRCGWLMHEAGHYSLTTKIGPDRHLQELIYGLGCGMSAAWWRNQHNKHHATPQKLKHDVDLDTLPLVAFHAHIAAKAKGPVLRAWLKLQGALFVPVSCLFVALGWQIYLHPRHAYRTRKYGELFWLALRQLVIFGVVLRGDSWPAAIAKYLAYDHVAASYIFTNFSLSHTHLPVSGADDFLHWVEYAAKHTTNLAPGPICNWWMANLNFQIEHHLFPSMPQCNHKVIAPRVKSFFEKHGLVYDVRPYFTCLKDTLVNLHTVGNNHAKKN